MNGSLRELLITGAAELGVSLSGEVIDRFFLLMQELRRWNQKINLTAITDDREIIIKHILDSMCVAHLLPDGANVLDLGSGGGFPAIPLALVRPDLRITSIDSVGKKIFFQRHAARLLALERFSAVHARGESLDDGHIGNYDIILSRAFSSISHFTIMVQSLLAKDGTIIAMKGKNGEEEAQEAKPLLEARGFEVQEVIRIRLPVTDDERNLVMLRMK